MEFIGWILVIFLASTCIANIWVNFVYEKKLKEHLAACKKFNELLGEALKEIRAAKKTTIRFPSRNLTLEQKLAASNKRKEWWAKKKGLMPLTPNPQEPKQD